MWQIIVLFLFLLALFGVVIPLAIATGLATAGLIGLVAFLTLAIGLSLLLGFLFASRTE